MGENMGPPDGYELRDPDGVMISIVGVGSNIARMETIEHEGGLWLSPQWYAMPGEGWMRPIRIVSLRGIQHEVSPATSHHVVVNEGLPADLEPPNVPIETAKRTLVIDWPEIWFSLPIAH